jgi:competence protein ComEA
MSVSLFVVKLAGNFVGKFVGKFVGRLALLLVIWATPGLAEVRHSVEINTATDEQLQSLKGIGPAMSGRILAERARAPFSSLADFDERVKGVGTITLRRWVADGLVLATPVQALGVQRSSAKSASSASSARAAGTPVIEQFQGGGVLPTPRSRVLNLP